MSMTEEQHKDVKRLANFLSREAINYAAESQRLSAEAEEYRTLAENRKEQAVILLDLLGDESA